MRRGPVTCLLDVIDRCHVDEDTGCWRWGLALACGGRVPTVRVGAGIVAGTPAGMHPARRIAWTMAGRPLRDGWIVFQAPCCADLRCIAPDHSEAGPEGLRGLQQRRSGRLRGDPARRAVAVRAALSRAVPVEVVREIEAQLATGRPQREIAAAFGCNRDTVSKINCRRHPHQLGGMRGASVFHLT
jgi:hypothetical protein